MYPWSFFRSSVVLLAAVHWHSPQSVKSGTHCQGPPVLLNGVGTVTRFTYGNRHASPRRTPLLSLWVLLWRDSLAIILHVCNFGRTRALIFDKSRRHEISSLSQARFVIIHFRISLSKRFIVRVWTATVILGKRDKPVLVEPSVVSYRVLYLCHCRKQDESRIGRYLRLISSTFTIIKKNLRDSYNLESLPLEIKKMGIE